MGMNQTPIKLVIREQQRGNFSSVQFREAPSRQQVIYVSSRTQSLLDSNWIWKKIPLKYDHWKYCDHLDRPFTFLY